MNGSEPDNPRGATPTSDQPVPSDGQPRDQDEMSADRALQEYEQPPSRDSGMEEVEEPLEDSTSPALQSRKRSSEESGAGSIANESNDEPSIYPSPSHISRTIIPESEAGSGDANRIPQPSVHPLEVPDPSFSNPSRKTSKHFASGKSGDCTLSDQSLSSKKSFIEDTPLEDMSKTGSSSKECHRGLSSATATRAAQGIALVGNPGTGKSTILNGLAGAPVFESGISLGGPMTMKMKRHEAEPYILYDTPGLNAMEDTKEAGLQLDKLLAEKTDMRLCFVVTLEHGRPRPVDASTIDVILSAIQVKSLDNSFGIIVNVVNEKLAERLMAEEDLVQRMQSAISGKYNTTYFHYELVNDELVDEDNGLLRNERLNAFVMSLPVTKKADTRVRRIDTESMDEKLVEHERLMQTERRRQQEEMEQQLRETAQDARRADQLEQQLTERCKGIERELRTQIVEDPVNVLGESKPQRDSERGQEKDEKNVEKKKGFRRRIGKRSNHR